jgi:FkbH-like protein
VLLVLLSKNNFNEVAQAFEVLPDMALRLNDFVAVRVNWRPKHENLRQIAQELNLGLDSFLFVDDEAFEREVMSYHLPDVRILSVNQDPLNILQSLAATETLDAFRMDEEDRLRSEDYVAQGRRRAFQEEKKGSVEDFLKSLDVEVTIASVNESSLPRVVQMLNKTNQFNVTTRRHTEVEVRRLVGSPRNMLLTLSLRDRFGDQGIVGFVLAVEESARENLQIDSFLLSCRVIGRGCEMALWSELLAGASQAGYKTMGAEYIATEKNQQVADLFDRLGMKLIEATNQSRRYQLALPASFEGPSWMKVSKVPYEQHFETV